MRKPQKMKLWRLAIIALLLLFCPIPFVSTTGGYLMALGVCVLLTVVCWIIFTLITPNSDEQDKTGE